MDFKRLIVSGEASDIDCAKQWDLIVQKNNQANGGYDYLNYIDLMQGYGRFMADYNFVRASLLELIRLNLEVGIVFMEGNEIFVQDEDIISDLKKRGYKIDTTDANTFCESINNAMHRVEHLITRMKMKANEINAMVSEKNGGSQETVTFDSIMAFLYSQFPNVPEDITLSRYNEMIKVLKLKHKKQEA